MQQYWLLESTYLETGSVNDSHNLMEKTGAKVCLPGTWYGHLPASC